MSKFLSRATHHIVFGEFIFKKSNFLTLYVSLMLHILESAYKATL